MLTMTRLPNEHFMPMGAVDNDARLSLSSGLNGYGHRHSPTVVSPLSLPARTAEYFGTDASTTPVKVPRIPSPSRGSPSLRAMAGVYGGQTPTVDSDRIQRLEAQNATMKRAWEEERRMLQSIRDAAETVYQQERDLWQSERTELLGQISQLQAQLANHAHALAARHSSPDRRNGITVAPQFRRAASPASLSPRTHPVASTFVPIDHIPTVANIAATTTITTNGISHHTSDTDSMASTDPVPVIDISDYHPDLEGVSLKKDAVVRETFTDGPSSSTSGSKPSSRNTSPPSDPESPKETARERTLQALSVDVTKRLTIHAGHTPTVSLSAVPSFTGTAVSNTANSSGSSTPTRSEAHITDDLVVTAETPAPEPVLLEMSTTKPLIDALMLEPLEQEDRALTGPLCVRNIPAKDELFFGALNERLVKVQSGEDALPTVLRNSDDEDEDADGDDLASLNNLRAILGRPKRQPKTDGPGDDDEVTPSAAKKAADDIPLRLKPSRNFGAPFGSMR